MMNVNNFQNSSLFMMEHMMEKCQQQQLYQAIKLAD